MDRAVDAAALAGSQLSNDLSVWTLFLNADLIVKLVILMLVLASVWSWAIIFEKFFKLRRLHQQADEFEDQFWSGGSLDEMYRQVGKEPTHPMAKVFAAASYVDYLSTSIARTLPRGLDVEVVRTDVLRAIDKLATEHHRTHVTSYVYSHAGLIWTRLQTRQAGRLLVVSNSGYG